jgi:hypothetical protein
MTLVEIGILLKTAMEERVDGRGRRMEVGEEWRREKNEQDHSTHVTAYESHHT